MTAKELLLSWLNDAYAMEHALIQVLEHHVKETQDHPSVRSKLQEHLEQKRLHAQSIEDCVQSLGGKTSMVKTGMASLFGQMQALSIGAAPDKFLKNVLVDYAAECYGVGSYTALVQAANALGAQHTAQVCLQILQEKQSMVQWIHDQLPSLVQQTLSQVTR